MLISVDKYTFMQDAGLACVWWESLSAPFTAEDMLSCSGPWHTGGDLSPVVPVVGSPHLSCIFGRACGLSVGLLGFFLLTLEEKGAFPSGIAFTELRRGG